MSPVNDGWVELPHAGLWARAVRTGRAHVAFWKHLYESFEDIGIVRTAARDGDEVILAIVSPPDFVAEADAVLADVVARASAPVAAAELPSRCREDWFLAEWTTS